MTESREPMEFPLEAYLELMALEPDQVPEERRPQIFRELARRAGPDLDPRAALWARVVLDAHGAPAARALGDDGYRRLLELLDLSPASVPPPDAGAPGGLAPDHPLGRLRPRRLLGLCLGVGLGLGLPLAVVDHFQFYLWPSETSVVNLVWQARRDALEGRSMEAAFRGLDNALVHARLSGASPWKLMEIHRSYGELVAEVMEPGPSSLVRDPWAPRAEPYPVGRERYEEAVRHMEAAILACPEPGLPLWEDWEAETALAHCFKVLFRCHELFGEAERVDDVRRRLLERVDRRDAPLSDTVRAALLATAALARSGQCVPELMWRATLMRLTDPDYLRARRLAVAGTLSSALKCTSSDLLHGFWLDPAWPPGSPEDLQGWRSWARTRELPPDRTAPLPPLADATRVARLLLEELPSGGRGVFRITDRLAGCAVGLARWLVRTGEEDLALELLEVTCRSIEDAGTGRCDEGMAHAYLQASRLAQELLLARGRAQDARALLRSARERLAAWTEEPSEPGSPPWRPVLLTALAALEAELDA